MLTYLLSSLNTQQLLATPLGALNSDWYDGWLNLTKGSFGLLTTTMTQMWAPTVMRVSGDRSVRGQIKKNAAGDLVCDFPDRLVLMANHQIYTDWLYLWWIAYTAGRHGNVFIVLKESLKKLPVIGWGMQLNRFIFLKRDWEQDKPSLGAHMQRLNALASPMWLMLFPEGTNLAPDTRQKSAAWAGKNRMRDMRHTLLPRATGLRFMLQELEATVDWLYDCTLAYEGVPRGAYAQDIFTLRASYLEGRPPRSVNMHWRRFKFSAIPLDNALAFESWLLARWREKDELIEYWYKHGSFPADEGAHVDPRDKTRVVRGCGRVETEVKASKWQDFLQVFAPIGVLALVLFTFYGALPTELMAPILKQIKGIEGEAVAEQKKYLGYDAKSGAFKAIDGGGGGVAAKKPLPIRPTAERRPSASSVGSRPVVGRRGSASTMATSMTGTTRKSERQVRFLGFDGTGYNEVSPAPSRDGNSRAASAAWSRAASVASSVAGDVAPSKIKPKKRLAFDGEKYTEVDAVAPKLSTSAAGSSASLPVRKPLPGSSANPPPKLTPASPAAPAKRLPYNKPTPAQMASKAASQQPGSQTPTATKAAAPLSKFNQAAAPASTKPAPSTTSSAKPPAAAAKPTIARKPVPVQVPKASAPATNGTAPKRPSTPGPQKLKTINNSNSVGGPVAAPKLPPIPVSPTQRGRRMSTAQLESARLGSQTRARKAGSVAGGGVRR